MPVRTNANGIDIINKPKAILTLPDNKKIKLIHKAPRTGGKAKPKSNRLTLSLLIVPLHEIQLTPQ